MRSTCWYLHCVELLHSGGGHKPFKYCIFYNQTFQLKNMPYQKESHIEASAKVNEKNCTKSIFHWCLLWLHQVSEDILKFTSRK